MFLKIQMIVQSMPSTREEKVEKDLRKIMDSQIEALF